MRRLDLNLLPVFVALMRERSVTRAGRALSLSQPAASAALARLRAAFSDELFVRNGNALEPTPRAEALMAELDDDEPLPLRVKNALRQLLKDGLPRKERVAEKFDMTVRTLQRHLHQAGTSYQQILDELRQELAEHYLLRSDLAIQDIACYLGFTESRSFHRSFKSWTGQTPGEFRESRRRDNPLG